MEERRRWACPDTEPEKEPGKHLVVPGSKHLFPECPAAYLRTASDVEELRARRGIEPFAPHLVGGSVHPAEIVAEDAWELESGSRMASSLPPKRRALAHLYLSEKAARERYAMELRKEARHGSAR